MISVEKASSIYAKLCAGERITADEREELEEYAKRFSNPNQNSPSLGPKKLHPVKATKTIFNN